MFKHKSMLLSITGHHRKDCLIGAKDFLINYSNLSQLNSAKWFDDGINYSVKLYSKLKDYTLFNIWDGKSSTIQSDEKIGYLHIYFMLDKKLSNLEQCINDLSSNGKYKDLIYGDSKNYKFAFTYNLRDFVLSK